MYRFLNPESLRNIRRREAEGKAKNSDADMCDALKLCVTSPTDR